MAELKGEMKIPHIMNFENFLQERRTNFLGREWIFKRIQEWQKDQGKSMKKIMMIVGPPGVKTLDLNGNNFFRSENLL